MTGIDQQAILQTKAAPQGHGKGQQDLTGDGAFLVFFGKGTATEVKTISGAPSIELERQQNPHAVTVQGSPPNSPMRGVAPPGGADVSGGTPSADHETDGHTRDLAASIATTRQDAAMLPLHETAVQNNSDDAATLPKSQWPPADGITLKQFHTHKASSALPLTPVTMDAQKFEPPDSVSLVNTAISAQILAPLQPEKPDAAPTVIDESAPPFVAPLMAQPYPNMVQKNPDTIFAMQGDHALQLPSKLNQAVSAVALYQLPNQPNVAGLLPANPVAGYTSTKQATVIPDTPSGASQTVTQGNSLTASAGAVDTATAVKNPNVSAQQAGPPDRMPKSETSPDTIQEPPAGPPRMVSGSDPAPTATISRYQTAALVQASGSSPQMVSLRQTNSSESPSGPSLASQSYATSNPGQPLPIGAATAPPPTPDTQRPLLRIARATHSDGVALAATQPITIATPLVQSATATLPHGLVPVSDLPHQIRQHATPGRPTSLELFMAPEELGKLRIFMTPDGDKIRIVIQAERPETMELLRRNSDSFSADLRQSGFGGASFSFGGWGDPPPNQTAQPQDASTTTFISASEHPHAPIKQSKPNSSSGLDLRV